MNIHRKLVSISMLGDKFTASTVSFGNITYSTILYITDIMGTTNILLCTFHLTVS